MKKLTVKGKYLYQDNKPFFWLGDTAWQMFDKLNLDEIKLYLKNRKGLGFNVIQTILLLDLPNDKNIKLQDIKPIKYWELVNTVIDYANDLGVYMALLPTWGNYAKNGYLNENNVIEYARFLTTFFKQNNIVWILGGDVRGDACVDVFNTFGNELKRLDTRLVTFHPFGRTGSYLWFNDCSWLDFNMFQSGHRRYDQLDVKSWDDDSMDEATFGEDAYKYVIKNYLYNIKKPCLDAEPSYEGVVQGLHDPSQPYWEARHVRRYAYWSVFEGACGFTYGNNAIIQFHRENDMNGSYGVRETWQEGLHSPGGQQMRFLKELMESVDYINGESHPEYIKNNKIRHDRVSVFAGNDYMFIYTYKGDELVIDISRYSNKTMEIYLMNPENNSLSYYGVVSNKNEVTIKTTRRRELSNDWVIVFKSK